MAIKAHLVLFLSLAYLQFNVKAAPLKNEGLRYEPVRVMTGVNFSVPLTKLNGIFTLEQNQDHLEGSDLVPQRTGKKWGSGKFGNEGGTTWENEKGGKWGGEKGWGNVGSGTSGGGSGGTWGGGNWGGGNGGGGSTPAVINCYNCNIYVNGARPGGNGGARTFAGLRSQNSTDVDSPEDQDDNEVKEQRQKFPPYNKVQGTRYPANNQLQGPQYPTANKGFGSYGSSIHLGKSVPQTSDQTEAALNFSNALWAEFLRQNMAKG